MWRLSRGMSSPEAALAGPVAQPASSTGRLTLEQLTGSEAGALEPLFREYFDWIETHLREDLGMEFDDVEIDHHYRAFTAELEAFLRPPGRLLLARIDGEPVGVGGLKRVDAVTGEIKRMYVRPAGRGRGVGRAVLERLVADARADGYRVVRLETMSFMTAAHALYRSVGFVEAVKFESETAAHGLVDGVTYMELALSPEAGMPPPGRRSGAQTPK